MFNNKQLQFLTKSRSEADCEKYCKKIKLSILIWKNAKKAYRLPPTFNAVEYVAGLVRNGTLR